MGKHREVDLLPLLMMLFGTNCLLLAIILLLNKIMGLIGG